MWICDKCGSKIVKSDDGYLLWKSKYMVEGGFDFQIVCHPKCTYDPQRGSSRALNRCTGIDGLNWLLTFLSKGSFRISLEGETEHKRLRQEDLDEIVEIIRRVQTPYYDTARLALDSQYVRDQYHNSPTYVIYKLQNLIDIVRHARK